MTRLKIGLRLGIAFGFVVALAAIIGVVLFLSPWLVAAFKAE